MPIRLSGMVSGIDTDAVVKELMSAQSLKKKKVDDKKTKLNWTQEKWEALNEKLLKLYRGTLTKAKTQGNYNTKKAISTNEQVATAKATMSAPKGSHTLEVNQLASAQYLTSGVIKSQDGSTVAASTKLVDLGIDKNTVITISAAKTAKTTNNSNIQKLTVTEGTTIADFVDSCKAAGLNANFDATQKRLFISSADSGIAQKFSITTTSVCADFATNTAKLKEQTGYNDSTTTPEQKEELDNLYKTLTTADTASAEYAAAYTRLQEFTENRTKTRYAEQFESAKNAYKNLEINNAYKTKAEELLAGTDFADKNDSSAWLASEAGQKWINDNDWTAENIAANPDVYDEAVKNAYSAAYNSAFEEEYVKVSTGDAYNAYRESVAADVDAKMAAIEAGLDVANGYTVKADATPEAADAIAKIKENAGLEADLPTQLSKELTELDTRINDYVTSSEELAAAQTPDGNSLLTKLGLAEISGDTEINSMTSGNVSGLTMVTAKNAEYVLDGAAMENSTNSFSVNNITLNLVGKTNGNAIQIGVENDGEAAYKVVKEFIKEFNDILKEMNEIYSAKSAKGYDPLTDEEKEAMTDDEVEKWETKIKDSLLRRDSTLNTLINSMKSAMMQQVKIDGKTCSLASFGIKTSSDYTEKGLLHIFGDEDDDTYSTEENELKEMLDTDPEFAMKGLTTIFQSLYDTMNEKMASDSQSSALKFYNDKQMKKQDDTYKKEIASWEKKLTEMENKYYKQFTAMEKALSSLQNQSNSLASMLGMSTGQ